MAHKLRIQRRQAMWWRLPEGAVCIDRSTKWGNPFRVEDCIDLGIASTVGEACVICRDAFRDWLVHGKDDTVASWGLQCDRLMELREWMLANIDQLRGKKLACFCRRNHPCHGDVLAELANQ